MKIITENEGYADAYSAWQICHQNLPIPDGYIFILPFFEGINRKLQLMIFEAGEKIPGHDSNYKGILIKANELNLNDNSTKPSKSAR